MALITTLVLCTRSQDSLPSVSVRMVLVVFSTLLDLRAEESRFLRRMKPPRCGEASGKPCALNWDQSQTIFALDHGKMSSLSSLNSPVRSIFICGALGSFVAVIAFLYVIASELLISEETLFTAHLKYVVDIIALLNRTGGSV